MGKKVVKHFEGESLTKQSFKAECDINRVMAKYRQTGLIPQVVGQQASFVDVPSMTYHEAQNALARANQGFAALPSEIRKRFGNSPMAFLEFMENPENIPEMVKLGLATIPERPEASAPAESAVAQPPAA